MYAFIEDHAINQSKQTLIQVFTAVIDEEFIRTLRAQLLNLLPHAIIIGTTTDGEIIDGEIRTGTTVLSFTLFDKTELQSSFINITIESSYEAGKSIASSVVSEKTKALIVFADSLQTNGKELLNGIGSVNSSVIVAGGLAGDGGQYKRTLVFNNDNISDHGVVAVALNSDELIVHVDYSIDWQHIGKVFTITHVEGNRVYTIDGRPATEIYRRYLGEAIFQILPQHRFPIIVERDGIRIARSILDVHPDGSISYTGDLANGEKVQFAFGNTDKLLTSTKTLVERLSKYPVESMFVYSCTARRRYLYQANSEDKVIKSPLQSLAPTVGFYSYGEFYHNKGKNELLNQGLTVIILSENTEVKSKVLFTEESADPQVSVDNLQILANLIKVSTEELKSLNETLEESEQRYRSLFEHNPDIVYSLDLKGKVLSINKAYSNILGYQIDNVGSIFKRLDLKDKLRILKFWRRVVKGEPQSFEVKARHKNGNRMYFHVTKVPIIVNGQVVGVYGIAKNITEQKKVQNEIVQLAYYDSLTDLPNRVLFQETFHSSIKKAKKENRILALFFIDIDRFKTINDTLGHILGDQLLKRAAKRLKSLVSGKGSVARFSGDEFIVILDSVEDVQEVEKIAQYILKEMKEPILINGQELSISTSFGISLYPQNGYEMEELLKTADSAMHKAKKLGRNRFQFYTTELNEKKAFEKLLLENHLRKALQRNEFILHYQPFVSLHSNQIEGCEALLRWEHPELGLISPATFIPLAEEMGLIEEIGYWVLKTACAQIKAWHKLGYQHLTISINVSGQQFQDDHFVKQVKRVLKENELEPKHLHLEITESIALEDVSHTMKVLKELSQLGVGVAMDDFGTGYSSLSYLKDFPIDVLKIDRSFIKDISLFKTEMAIVKAIITMSQSLLIRVLAEGVETEEQLYLLRESGCDIIQGFLFSKPLPKNEFEELMKNKICLEGPCE